MREPTPARSSGTKRGQSGPRTRVLLKDLSGRLPAGPHHPAIPSDSCGSWGSSHAGAPGAGIIYYSRRVVPPFRPLSIVLLITFRGERPGTVIKLLILIRRRAPAPPRPAVRSDRADAQVSRCNLFRRPGGGGPGQRGAGGWEAGGAGLQDKTGKKIKSKTKQNRWCKLRGLFVCRRV